MSSIINRMNNSIKFSYLYLLLGVIALIVGILITKNTVEFTQLASTANGKVSKLVVIERKFYPEVSFSNSENETVVFTSNYGCKPACYKEGDTVSVLYLPNSPKKAQLNTFFSLWMPTILTCGIGILFVVFSLFHIKRHKE